MRNFALTTVICVLGLSACQKPASSQAEPSQSTATQSAPAPTATPVSTKAPAAEAPVNLANTLRVCADPGNMPLSNQAGQGYQNKIAQLLGKSMGLQVQYFWRTYYALGLARGTINADKCDVLMDMPPDFEMGLTTKPYFRSTYVLVSRSDNPIKPTSLDDPILKKIHLGVFESSPARSALYDHGVKGEVQYLFYDSARRPQDHPARLVEQVAAGKLDAAESWGPAAGYYAKQDGLEVLPLNRMTDTVLEYSASLAVKHGNTELRDRLNKALEQNQDAIRAILQDYNIPLVQCSDCVISGSLPAHGPYPAPPPFRDEPTSDPKAFALMQQRVQDGASVQDELQSAVRANDPSRVSWLLAHGADPNARDDQGALPLQHAIRMRGTAVGEALLKGGAELEGTSADGWTPLMSALWDGDEHVVAWLLQKHPQINVVSSDGWTPLLVAIQGGSADLAAKVLAAGANADLANQAGFTPLMFAIANNQPDTVHRLLEKKVDVNHANKAGVDALMLAVASRQQPLIRSLLAAGADPHRADQQGDSAISLAQKTGDPKLLALVAATYHTP